MAKNLGTEETAPRVALGIKVSRKELDEKSEHKPGFLDQKRPEIVPATKDGKPLLMELPPYNPDKVPRTSLAERLRKRIAREEGK